MAHEVQRRMTGLSAMRGQVNCAVCLCLCRCSRQRLGKWYTNHLAAGHCNNLAMTRVKALAYRQGPHTCSATWSGSSGSRGMLLPA